MATTNGKSYTAMKPRPITITARIESARLEVPQQYSSYYLLAARIAVNDIAMKPLARARRVEEILVPSRAHVKKFDVLLIRHAPQARRELLKIFQPLEQRHVLEVFFRHHSAGAMAPVRTRISDEEAFLIWRITLRIASGS